jgi:hypothetical protein
VIAVTPSLNLIRGTVGDAEASMQTKTKSRYGISQSARSKSRLRAKIARPAVPSAGRGERQRLGLEAGSATHGEGAPPPARHHRRPGVRDGQNLVGDVLWDNGEPFEASPI